MTTGTTQIEMPAMGESVTEGTVLEWHVAEGDTVSEGETIVEVSTDKVDAEVPAPVSGTITKILKQADEDVQVGEALAEIEPGEGGGSIDGAASAGSDAGEASTDGEGSTDGGGPQVTEVEIAMPGMGASVTEGAILG